LLSLKNRELIDFCEERVIVGLPFMDAETNKLMRLSFIAGESDNERIDAAELSALDEMGLKRIEHIYYFNKAKEFASNISKIISQYKWDYYYKQIRVTATGLTSSNSGLVTANEISKLRITLNDLLIQSLNDQAVRRINAGDFMKSHEEYMKTQERLAESLLRIPQENINESEVTDEKQQEKALS
jgi:DNA polymerase III alpha subunit (gram-positive type)